MSARPEAASRPAPRARAGGAGAAEPRQRLHNMSAPPRATISYRPLPGPGDSRGGAQPGIGLRRVCRIDVAGHFWPLPQGVGRDIAHYALWQHTLEPQRRLLAQALAEEGGAETPEAELAARVAAMAADAVLEALREVALRADLDALGLPAFGLLHPARGPSAVAATGCMRLAAAVLARRRGGIFLRAADPLPLSSVTEALDLWTPEPAPAKEPR